MSLQLQNLTKKVGPETHISVISLTLEPGTFNILLGRTLAGKTTLMRLMAGLERPSSGKVLMNDKDVTQVPVRRRNVAMVYQQFINYPSLSVYQNIASPLVLARVPADEIDRRVREVAEMLHIESLLDRQPLELSGGQQQRTAMARALVKDAELLLLDEPLVNLDYKLREELRSIFEERKSIIVYATTEPHEALILGGHCAVLDGGRIAQFGPTLEVYQCPASIKAMDSLAAQQDRVMQRLERAKVQKVCGPKLNPKRDPAYWFKQPGAPKPKLADEKPPGQTVPYDQLLKAWSEGRVR